MKVQLHSSLEPPLQTMQSGPDSFDKSRFVTTFLTVRGVTEICSFRLVLEGKAGKEIPEPSRLEFLENFLGNNFALSDVEDNNSGLFNRGVVADLLLLRTLLAICQKFRELSLFCFISICKFGSFKNAFAVITSLSELYFRVRRFILLIQMKNV